MPRTATTTELDVLGDLERSVPSVRVEIQNVDETWKDLTNLSGTGFSNLDFFKRASITDDSDAPTWTGTVELSESQVAADGSVISIAPDVETSPANVDDASAYAPLIDGMRRIRIYATTARLDGTDSSEQKMFDGYVVSSEQQGDLKLAIADLGHLLLTTQVEDERIYGSDDGDLLQDVVQQILDDVMGTGVITLVTDAAIVAENVMVKKFSFGRPRLLTGLRDLAINTIGANIRYRWNGDDMELQLFMPPRGNTTPDFTFSSDNYEATPRFSRNTEDVRNAGRCYYRDRDKKSVAFVSAVVPDSVLRYKRRYFEFKEAATSQIDTEEEAQLFLDTAIGDLAFPKAEKGFTTLFAWPFQVYDLFEMTANGKQYTTNQLQAVQRITHTWGTAKETRTAFETRGTIAGYTKNWLIREGDGIRPQDFDSLFLSIGMAAEGTMYGGELFDRETNGAVYPTLFCGKNVRRIHIWARENAPGTLVPEWPPTGSDAFKAATIERPEGKKSIEGNFIWPGFGATPADGDPYNGVKFWRTMPVIPTGRSNKPVIRTVVIKPEMFDGSFGAEQRQIATAVDGSAPLGGDPPAFPDISITRIDATTVQIEFTMPSAGSPWLMGPVFLRDGITIEAVDMNQLEDEQPGLGAGPYIWLDEGLHADKAYRYSAFLYDGWSGPRTRVTIDPWGTAFGFASGTPKIAFPSGGPRVEIGIAGAPGGTDTIGIEKSKDSGQYDPWMQAARRAVGDFPYYDVLVKAGQYYRLVAYDSGGAVLDTSKPFFWRSPLAFTTGPA